MRVVMTLLVRDEIDIVDDFLRYHLERGVDFVIATDHRSSDGTTKVLERYEREGRLHLIRETSESFRQAEWVTRMARLAATDFGAEWVVNSDVDEFWWPRDGSLREVLSSVPPRFGVVHGLWRHFVLRPEGGEPFHERMVVRRRPASEETSTYAPAFKSVHRADPEVIVGRGNHKALGARLAPLRDWLPLEVLHFPVRARAQLERKYRREEESLPADIGLTRHQAAAVAGFRERGVDAVVAEHLVDDAALQAGLADGSLAIDVRVRDALRGGAATQATLADDVTLATEAGEVQPSDSVVRLSWHVGRARRRVEELEAARAVRGVRRLRPSRPAA
ncbi:MAG TPA: glycosyltransferase family 2 protein [Gaiellaceae bacterium]|nr:glycosyltransferase family 2 protein [Gaiellaceae bacterium]